MASNAQTTPFGLSQNRFARQKALDVIQQTGRSLPCTVTNVRASIVTVSFQISTVTLLPVTIPIIGSEYVRLPIQIGCQGFTLASDAYLGGVSGLGGGVADLTQRANLTALVFAPIGNVNFSSVDPNAVTIYGPNGVVMRDTGSDSVVTVTPGSIVMVSNGNTLTLSAAGLNINAPSGVVINGITWAV